MRVGLACPDEMSARVRADRNTQWPRSHSFPDQVALEDGVVGNTRTNWESRTDHAIDIDVLKILADQSQPFWKLRSWGNLLMVKSLILDSPSGLTRVVG